VSTLSASRRKEQASLRSSESKRLRLFQQLDHTLQYSPDTAAIEIAMIEAERDLRLRYRNEIRFRFLPAWCFFAGTETENHGLIGQGNRRAPFHPESAEV